MNLLRFSLFSFALFFTGDPLFSESYENRSEIEQAIASKDTAQLRLLVKKYTDKGLSLDELAQISSQTGNTALSKAVQVAKKTKLKESGMTTGEFLEAALFIETDLQASIEKKKYYFPKEETQLSVTIEYDPETKKSFMNLSGKKANIDKGKTKTVTKALLYDHSDPEMVARLEQSENMDEELEFMKKLKGLKGLYNLIGTTTHTSAGKNFQTAYTTLYSPGALIRALDNGYEFSLHEKAKIAFDLLQGLDELHSRDIAHRDLHLKNYFLDVSKGEVNQREIKAVIADFGRMQNLSHAKGVAPQGNPKFSAPEGLFKKMLKGDDYLATDVYALAMALHRLYYGKMPKWDLDKYLSDEKSPENERYKAAVHEIERELAKRKKVLEVQATIRPLSPEEQFEALILKMLDPNPKKRGSAKENRKAMKRILDQTYPK